MADKPSIKVSPAALKHANKGKKRQSNYLEWKDNKRKVLKDMGLAHTGRKGIQRLAKPDPNVNRVCACKHNGCSTLPYDERKKMHDSFYQLSFNEQSAYLINHMEISNPKRRNVPEDVSTRQCSVKYTVSLSSGEKSVVCKKNTCDIFAFTPRRLQVLQEKMKSGILNPTDMRGKHNNRPHKITDAVHESVIEHINSFPSQENHYSRNSSKKKCLSPNLNVGKMHALYNELNPNKTVSIHYYRDIFRAEFDLRFGNPRSDTCKTCDSYYIQLIAAETDEQCNKVSLESELHHRKAESAYKTLETDTQNSKTNPNIVVLCVDLEQVLFCPTLTHSNIFYQRQFSSYNFCVHNVGSNEGVMYLWHEAVANRGSAEIASCVLKHITTYFQVLQPGEERKLIIWSDRCVGQNNNWKMLLIFQYIVALGYFTEANQKFLTSGHSFLPCDRDFALIERKKKTSPVYVPRQWIEVITSARSSNPFIVDYMDREDFKNFSPLEATLQKDSKLKVTAIAWFQFSSEDPTSVRARTKHNVLEPWTTYVMTKRKRGGLAMPYTITPLNCLASLYDKSLPIKPEKKKRLIGHVPIPTSPIPRFLHGTSLKHVKMCTTM